MAYTKTHAIEDGLQDVREAEHARDMALATLDAAEADTLATAHDIFLARDAADRAFRRVARAHRRLRRALSLPG